MDRPAVVAFALGHGVQRADVAKKQILASQSNPAAFRAVGARLTAALTHHDSALRGKWVAFRPSAGNAVVEKRQIISVSVCPSRRSKRIPAGGLPDPTAKVSGAGCGGRASATRIGSR